MPAIEPRHDIYQADCLIGHSFGTSIDADSVNAHLGTIMLDLAYGRPMIADRTLVNAIPHAEDQIGHIVEGPIMNHKAQGVGTWGVLVEAAQFMEEHRLELPLMIAQSYHARRVVRQAAKLGISSITPMGLPKDFDTHSEQLWTRHAALWVPANALGSLLLKYRSQL